MNRLVRGLLGRARGVDRRLGQRADRRTILVDARTPVNFTMVRPVVQAMAHDPRLAFFFTASEEPAKLQQIYKEANGIRTIHPARAALRRFDAYVASDFMWASLPRGTRRVQVFHGVGGKYGFDAPSTSMREWDRLFFVNQRRLRNFVRSGAIDADSPAIRLIGMPKVDCLVDGTYDREAVLSGLGLDPSRPTVLYAPTWSPASSLNAIGVELMRALAALPVNLVVKLHDRSCDPRERYSGGVDWIARVRSTLAPGGQALAAGHDISPYLVASDLMITDHSSAGFEFLLRDRPLVRIHRPELLRLANVHPDYVELLASVSHSTSGLEDTVRAVEEGLADPTARSADRRHVAADLFHDPGRATARSVAALYDVVELEAAPTAHTLREAECQPSA
jgi:CDP-glycerol glycerophosphotransferase (TagB/SpsB family)